MTTTHDSLRVWIAKHLLASSLFVLFLFLVLGYAFLFRPELAAIRNADLGARVAQERQAKQAYLQKLDELDAQYKAFAPEDVTRVREMIPESQDIPSLLATFEAAAQASDIQLSSVNFAAGDTTGLENVSGLGAVSVSLALKHGSYERFKLFLDALEANLRLFDVRGASVKPADANYTLTIRTYVRSKTSA